jgi:arginine repressor
MLSDKNKVVIRTVLQTAVGVALVVPELVDQLGLSQTAGWVAGVLAISATVTRFMASPLGQKLMGALRTDEKTDKK